MFASNSSQVSASAANYIEDVFSTYLYAGTGSAQSINNGIDLAGKGGLVWGKARNTATDNVLMDTAQGTSKYLVSNTTAGVATSSTVITAFNSNGYTLGTNSVTNNNTTNYVGWSFRKQAKFFDVVTWTGNGANRTISHNLGSVPGCIIVKRIDTTGAWQVYHRSLANTEYIVLNSTSAKATGATRWNSSTPTSTEFSLGTDTSVNANGGTYVAYLFAHDAGGFGSAGTDNVVTCGSYTGNGSATGPSISLGYEPQWVMIKNSSASGSWQIIDTMRDMSVTGNAETVANTATAEATVQYIAPSATGFNVVSTSSQVNTNTNTYIYIAIRRGPMKTPTDATKVFAPVLETPISGNTTVTTGFPVDLGIAQLRGSSGYDNTVLDRLRGGNLTYWNSLRTTATAAEQIGGTITGLSFQNNTGIVDANYLYNDRGFTTSTIWWTFKRAPSFFDAVCYTGTGAASQTYTHNLGVAPEMMIVKSRSNSTSWAVYHSALGATNYVRLNLDGASAASSLYWNDTAPTSSVFTVGNGSPTGAGGYTYIAYLFASCPGVSKVGSYTGTGTTKQINCGFTGGARFVLIKRTDDLGDWYVWDSARGIVAGNDPYLWLDSTDAEVTNTDYIDTYSAGFEISSTAPAAVNANGGTYIYLAIA